MREKKEKNRSQNKKKNTSLSSQTGPIYAHIYNLPYPPIRARGRRPTAGKARRRGKNNRDGGKGAFGFPLEINKHDKTHYPLLSSPTSATSDIYRSPPYTVAVLNTLATLLGATHPCSQMIILT